MANTFKFGNGEWAIGKETALAYNDENNNFKPLPFSFDRGSIATVVNKDGLIETVGVDEPRIDFLNNTKGHLLLEPSRQNKLLQSNQFDTTWALGSTLSLTGGQTSALTGNNDAWLLSSDGTSGFGQINQSVSFSGSHVFSVFAKKGTNDIISLRSLSGLDVRAEFNLNTGSLVGASNTTSTEIKSYGNGWYRVSMTFSATNTNVYIYPNQIGAADEGNIYIQNAQLEAGDYITSYIPTSGSAVTRSADDASNGGNFQVFDNDSAVWFIDCERIGLEGGRTIALENASGTEQLRFHLDSPVALGRFRDSLASFDTIGGQFTATVGLRIKCALKINGTTLNVFVNGSKVGSDYTRPTSFDIQKMHIYDKGFKINDIKFYNTALSDTELQALTSN